MSLLKPNRGDKPRAKKNHAETTEPDDSKVWSAYHRDMVDAITMENAIRAERREYVETLYREYKADQARERQRAAYRRAVRKREAMIDGWLGNLGNLDIADRVRKMAREAGPSVIDFVEFKNRPKKRKKRDRLGIL